MCAIFLRWKLGTLLFAATLASGCSQGEGLPPPGVTVVYERRPAYLYSLEADETHLYWAEAAERLVVLRAPKSGAGPVVELGTWYGGDVSKRIIDVDDAYVFWVENTHINRWSKTDGSTAQIELGNPGSGGWAIVEQGDFLYFTETRCMRFGRVPKLGGAPNFVTVPAQPDGGGAYVAVDDTHVFCGHLTNLWMAPKEGGPATELAVVPAEQRVGPMASDGTDVYWDNQRTNPGSSEVNLAMVSKAGGPITDLGTTGIAAAVIRFDAKRNRLYWTTYGTINQNSVLSFSLSLTERTFVTLAEKQTVLGGMAQDDQYVYWVSQTAIMRVPK